MSEYEERPHPLYPETRQIYKKIHLYPPKECDSCSKIDHEVDFYEVSKIDAQPTWMTPKTALEVKVQLKKLCKRCHILENSSSEDILKNFLHHV